jgi:hypothetical protein
MNEYLYSRARQARVRNFAAQSEHHSVALSPDGPPLAYTLPVSNQISFSCRQ